MCKCSPEDVHNYGPCGEGCMSLVTTLEPTPAAFVEIVRGELRKRGVNGPGVASITVKNNRATLNWLNQGKACAVSLDRHFDRFMDRREFKAGLTEAIDKAFFASGD